VSAADILEILQPIWNDKPETAKRVLQRMNATFDSAILRGSRERANPCIGVLRELGPGSSAVAHHPAMPWRDVPAFVNSLRTSSARPVTRLLFEFLILTAARSAEVRGALWDEIDFIEQTWTIPGDDLVTGRRMKSGEPHSVPLTTQIVSVLEQARKISSGPLVFPGNWGQPLSDNVLSKHMRDNGLSATPHGFRSSFKDWAAENGVRDEVSEAALAHTDRDRVRAAYRRTRFLDERRLVMQRWGDFISRGRVKQSEARP
jgi:integrase